MFWGKLCSCELSFQRKIVMLFSFSRCFITNISLDVYPLKAPVGEVFDEHTIVDHVFDRVAVGRDKYWDTLLRGHLNDLFVDRIIPNIYLKDFTRHSDKINKFFNREADCAECRIL